LYFFITVSLASNIFLLIGTHWGERLMYLPGLGIVFAMAILIERLSAKLKEESAQRQKVAMMITGVFVLIYGGMTVARNPIWKSNETVFRSGLVSAPNSTRVQYYLGNFYEKEDYLAGKDSLTQDSILRVAEGYLHRSLELSPKFIDAWNQLGLIYYHKRKLPQAIDTYLKGIATGTADATIYNNLGTAYFVSGQFPLAFEAFSTAVQMNPNYSDALCNLGSVYGRAGKYDLAISNFERCLQLDPRNKTALYFLGITYRSKGNEALAQQFINASENIK
jgi:tetratricopeptide (TPR) repeat protein